MGKIDSEKLSKAINYAAKLKFDDEIERKKRVEKGDITADLPPGHPLLIAIENAKIRIEQNEEAEKEKKQYIEKTKKKKAYKLQRRNQEQKEADEKNKKKDIKEYNERLEKLACNIADFGKFIDNFNDKFPKLNVFRLKRMLVTTYQGLVRSQLKHNGES